MQLSRYIKYMNTIHFTSNGNDVVSISEGHNGECLMVINSLNNPDPVSIVFANTREAIMILLKTVSAISKLEEGGDENVRN